MKTLTDFVDCPFCGMPAMEYQPDFSAWCSGCGVDFDPHDVAEFRRCGNAYHFAMNGHSLGTYLAKGVSQYDDTLYEFEREDGKQLDVAFIDGNRVAIISSDALDDWIDRNEP